MKSTMAVGKFDQPAINDLASQSVVMNSQKTGSRFIES